MDVFNQGLVGAAPESLHRSPETLYLYACDTLSIRFVPVEACGGKAILKK